MIAVTTNMDLLTEVSDFDRRDYNIDLLREVNDFFIS